MEPARVSASAPQNSPSCLRTYQGAFSDHASLVLSLHRATLCRMQRQRHARPPEWDAYVRMARVVSFPDPRRGARVSLVARVREYYGPASLGPRRIATGLAHLDDQRKDNGRGGRLATVGTMALFYFSSTSAAV